MKRRTDQERKQMLDELEDMKKSMSQSLIDPFTYQLLTALTNLCGAVVELEGRIEKLEQEGQ